MSRLASTEIVLRLLDSAERDLATVRRSWQPVAEQKLTGPPPSGVGGTWPTSEHGEQTSEDGWDVPGHWIPAVYGDDHPDPCGEQAISTRRQPEAVDQQAQLMTLDALSRLHKAAVALAGRVPAMSTAINAKRDPRDGRTEKELELKKLGAVEAESACMVCDLGVSVVGRLRAGLCDRDRKRWEQDGRPDRGLWIAERRARMDTDDEVEEAA